jgi:hypothetical protein
VIKGYSILPCMCNTHNNHTLIATGTYPCKYVQFKPLLSASIPMPKYLTVVVPSRLEKSGFLSAPSAFTVASTPSPTTSVGADADNDFTMLARLQGLPIHVPLGPCPLCSGACFPTKTHIQAECKAKKDLRSKAMEEKTQAVTAPKIELKAKRQEKLIASAEAKAAKAAASADELCVKLAKAIRANTNDSASAKTPAPLGTTHSCKKSKGPAGSLIVSMAA